jgi:hypothetical protein
VAEVADAEEMRPLLERHKRLAGQFQHQRAPMQQVAGQLEVFHQQFDFNLGHHQVEVAAVQGGDFPLGQVGIGHSLEFLVQGRGEEVAEILARVIALQALLQALMPGVAQALQIGGLQYPQSTGAVLLDPPAELFFHHELVEQHDVGRKFLNERVEAAVIEFDGHFADAQRDQVGTLLAGAGRAAEGDVPAFAKEGVEDLHDVPTGSR